MLGGAVALAVIMQQREAEKKPPADYTGKPMELPQMPSLPKIPSLKLPTNLPDLTIGKIPGNFLFTILFGSVFALIGGGLMFFGVMDSVKAASSNSWPTVRGTILSSEISSSTDSDSDTTYTSDIRYSYSVGGSPIEGSQVLFGEGSTSDYDAVQKLVDRYPEKSLVTVYYNPDDPTEAVLEPGFNAWLLLPLGIGGVFLLVGLGVGGGSLLAAMRQARA